MAIGSDIVAKAMKGVTDFFYIMGVPMMEIEKACMKLGLRGIDVRHEQAAAMAGFAYSRLLNRPSFCMAASVRALRTRGPIARPSLRSAARRQSLRAVRGHYLADYTIDTRESEFSEGTGCRTAARSDSISMETALVDDVAAAVDIQRFAGGKAAASCARKAVATPHVAAQAIGQSRGRRTILSRRSRDTFDNTRRKRHASCGSDRN
jgi:hypothetical protein